MELSAKQEKKYRKIQTFLMPVFYRQFHLRRNTLLEKAKQQQLFSFQKSFEASLEEASKQTLFLQNFHRKGPVHYINLSFLLSNALSGEHLLKIDFGGELGAGDMNEIDCYWDYANLFDFFEEDIAIFEKTLKKQIPRIKEYEIQEIRMQYWIANYKILEEILYYFIQSPVILSILEPIRKFPIHVLYGSYLSESEVIGTI